MALYNAHITITDPASSEETYDCDTQSFVGAAADVVYDGLANMQQVSQRLLRELGGGGLEADEVCFVPRQLVGKLHVGMVLETTAMHFSGGTITGIDPVSGRLLLQHAAAHAPAAS